MKKGISFFVSVILMTTAVGCGSINDKIDKNFRDMQSYTAVAKVKVHGNKSTAEYKVKQSWKAPDKYRVEILEPERMAGTITVYTDGEMILQGKDSPVQRIERQMAEPDKDFMFISDFVTEYFEQAEIPEFGEDSGEEIVLTSARQGKDKDRFVQNLVIDAKMGKPLKLVTYNDKGDEVVSVEYNEFVPNCEMDDGLFAE